MHSANPKLIAIAVLALPLAAQAANKQIQALQQDVATLHQQVHRLQQSVDEDSASIKVLTRQTLDAVSALNTKLAVLSTHLTDQLRDTQNSLAAPAAGLGARSDRIASEVRDLNQSVTALSSRLGSLEQRLIDLSNTVKASQGSAGTQLAPVDISARKLYQSATADELKGDANLARQEFRDYLKYFGSSDLAGNAEFHLGELCYQRGDFAKALTHFERVATQYPNDDRMPDALYMKGLTLIKLGRHVEGISELRDVASRFGSSPVGAEARSELKRLGAAPSVS
jgi:TolA-binding protein